MMFAYPLRNCLPFLRYWPATYRPLDSTRLDTALFPYFLGFSPAPFFYLLLEELFAILTFA